MKLHLKIVPFLLVGWLHLASSQASVKLASSTSMIKLDEEFNLTCTVDNFAAHDTTDYEVRFALSPGRTSPSFTQYTLGRFYKNTAGALVWRNTNNFEYKFSTSQEKESFPSFQITVWPKDVDANAIYQCSLFNVTESVTEALVSSTWESQFEFSHTQTQPALTSAEVSLEVSKDSDNYIAKCTAKVSPTNRNFNVYFVSDFDDVEKRNQFGYYSVNFNTKSIAANFAGSQTKDINIYPQQITTYPTFQVLVQSKHDLDFIKSKLQCYVQVDIPTVDNAPSMRTIYFSNGAGSAAASSMLALVLIALVKLVNY